MADIEKEIRIAFEGDDRVSGVIKGISGGLDSFAGKIQGVTGPLADMADKVLAIEAAFGILAAGGLFLSLKAFSEFESASAELNKVLDSNTESLSDAQTEARNLAGAYGESANDILGSFANFRQAGFDLAESMTLTRDALDLVIAGDLDMHEASEILIGSLKGMKLEADDGRRIIDALNETSNNYATNVRELGTGLREISPIIAQMGFSMEEAIGIITPVIEVFRSGAEAGVALRTGLLKLIDDAAPVRDALKSIGVAQLDANGNLRSGRDILFDVAKAFQTADDDQKLFLASQLVGIRQAPKMVEVFDQLAYTTEITAVAMNSMGSAAREVEIRLGTLEKQVDRFVVAFKDIGIEVGSQFAGAATEVLKGSTEIEKALTQMVGAGTFDPVFNLINEFGFNLAGNLKEIAKIMPEAFADVDWSELITSIKGLGTEIEELFEAFFGEIDLTTAEGLTKFVQKLIDGFTALTNVTAGILDAFEPFVEMLSDMVEKFTESDAETQKFVGQILGVGKAVNEILNNFGLLTGALDLLAGSVALLAATRIPSLITGLGNLGIASTGLIGILGKVAAAAGAFGIGWIIGDKLAETVPWVDKFGIGLADLALSFSGLDQKSINFVEDRAKETEAAGKAAVAAVKLADGLDLLPESKQIAIDIELKDFFSEIDQAEYVLEHMPKQKAVEILPEVNESEWDKAKQFIIKEIPGTDIVEIVFNPDLSSLADTKKALDEVPDEKIIIAELENRTEFQIAQMKEQFDLLQTALELKAKLDITEVQEHAESFRETVDAIGASFLQTGEVILGLASGLDNLTSFQAHEVIELMKAESRRRDELLAVQKEQALVEIDYIQKKAAALERGEGFITIQMDGVYPELELVMHKIIERTQIRTNQEGLEFLLGL